MKELLHFKNYFSINEKHLVYKGAEAKLDPIEIKGEVPLPPAPGPELIDIKAEEMVDQAFKKMSGLKEKSHIERANRDQDKITQLFDRCVKGMPDAANKAYKLEEDHLTSVKNRILSNNNDKDRYKKLATYMNETLANLNKLANSGKLNFQNVENLFAEKMQGKRVTIDAIDPKLEKQIANIKKQGKYIAARYASMGLELSQAADGAKRIMDVAQKIYEKNNGDIDIVNQFMSKVQSIMKNAPRGSQAASVVAGRIGDLIADYT